MLGIYSKYIDELYDRADSIVIIDANGYVEYSVTYDYKYSCLTKDDYIGKYILDVYPSLTKETSTHFRVMRTNQPIIKEKQNIVDMYGDHYSLVNSTFPITAGDSVPLGTIELSILISKNQEPYKGPQGKIGNTSFKNIKKLYTVDDIITNNPIMNSIKDDIQKLSSSSSCVMIWGETGTGKELIAESFHTTRRSQGVLCID